MADDIEAGRESVEKSLQLLAKQLDLGTSRLRLAELDRLAQDPALWADQPAAQKILSERTRLSRGLEAYDAARQSLSDLLMLWNLAQEESEDSTARAVQADLAALDEKLKAEVFLALFSDPADHCAAFLEIHAGAGGTESCDWAAMLLRMYIHYGEKAGYKISFMDELAGEEAGIRSVVIKIAGDHAYGWLKMESGVHRLVRISPFDSGARRHTSFASVWVYPEVDDSVKIDIQDKDLRIDVFRASGAGGQHVNRTESAVRITHSPTGIIVQCQNQRSQHQNKAAAMKMLKARLYEEEVRRRNAEKQATHEAKEDIGWGHQIRSYVLHPYQMIKDLRTGYTTSDTQSVLDGEITGFLQSSLHWRLDPEAKVPKEDDEFLKDSVEK